MTMISCTAEDAIWLQNFVQNAQLKTIDETKKQRSENCIKINAARSLLQRCVEIIENLENLKKTMTENVSTMSRADWKTKTQEIGNFKDELGRIMSQFEYDTISELNKKLAQRRRKRIAISRRKQDSTSRHEQEAKRLRALHAKIDQNLENECISFEIEQEEAKFEKESDEVLGDVRRSKQEARRQISLLTALIKLRTFREKNADTSGTKLIPEHKQLFLSKTEQLLNMWNMAVEKYTKEETELKEMLEKKRLLCDRKRLEAEDTVDEWMTVLFDRKPSVCDSNYELFTIADNNLQAFVSIRSCWDMFLDKYEGTSIPIGWVLPPEKPMEAWKSYLEIKQ